MATDKPIRIKRAPHNAENQYFLGRRDTAQDRTLSYEARGVLFYLLSKPTDWIVRPKDLQQEGAGRDKVYRILGELEQHRYLFRDFTRNSEGVITGLEYVVYEEPFPENPDTAKPDTVQPDTANKEHTKDRKKQSKDSDKEKTPRKRDPFFDSIARDYFGVSLEDKSAVGLIGARVARVKRELLAADSGISPEELQAVAQWFRAQFPGLDMPTHAESIGNAVVNYRKVKNTVSNGRYHDYVDHPNQELYPGVKISKAEAEAYLKSEGFE